MVKFRKASLMLLAVLLVFACSVTALAAGESAPARLGYVTDAASLLTSGQKAELESRAGEISRRFGLGVYVIVVDDYRDYSGYREIYDCCIDIYDSCQLGWGEDRAGTILMLSMDERDYALDFHGSRADYAFTESGRDAMEERFLKYFRNNDFYGGFSEYLDCCEEYLLAAENGTPVEKAASKSQGIGIFALIPGLIAALITGVCMAAPMRTAGEKREADQYAVPGSLQLRRQSDMFLHRTVTRRPRQTNSGGSGSTHHSSGSHSGSTHHSSGSHSGRSGKF